MNTDPCSSVFICGFAFGCGSTALWNSWPAKPPRIPRISRKRSPRFGCQRLGFKQRSRPQFLLAALLCLSLPHVVGDIDAQGVAVRRNHDEHFRRDLLLAEEKHVGGLFPP